MSQTERKSIYLVLLRSNTLLSHLIHITTGDEYTHAAISLDKNLNYMFSFGRRHPRNPFTGGFRRECLNEGLYAYHNTLPGIILELEISSAQHALLTNCLEEFILNTYRYGYNYLGLVGSLTHTCMDSGNRFLCSQFVYHVLHQAGICDLGISSALVRPQNLLEIGGKIVYCGDLKEYQTQDPTPVPPLSLLSRAG